MACRKTAGEPRRGRPWDLPLEDDRVLLIAASWRTNLTMRQFAPRFGAVIADGGCRGTGLVIPHRRDPGQSELPPWKEEKEEHNASRRTIRARVEHAFARRKTGKILRDCRLKADGVHHAMLGIAHLNHVGSRD